MIAAQGQDWNSKRHSTHPVSLVEDPDRYLIQDFFPFRCSGGEFTEVSDTDMQGDFNAFETYRVIM